jgi:hypothetical protein
MLTTAIRKNLDELIQLLGQLSESDYTNPCPSLSNATIGEHTRHIIEMFQCLHVSYHEGVVNYDARKRNALIQTNTGFAIQSIEEVKGKLEKDNKSLKLLQVIDGQEVLIDSNYIRELLYNLEHCIHHQALIKVAILQCEGIEIHPDFGVARSTIEYRRQCAQ